MNNQGNDNYIGTDFSTGDKIAWAMLITELLYLFIAR